MSRVFKVTVRHDDSGGKLLRDYSIEGSGTMPRRRYVILVHGYNVSGPSAAAEFEEIADLFLKAAPKLRSQLGMFLWPGDEPWRIVSTFSYGKQIGNASASAVQFANYLQRLTNPEGDIPHIVIIAHSLGSRVVLEALERVQPTSRRRKIQAFLMAAAFPVTRVPSLSAFEKTSISVFYSSSDTALRRYFPRIEDSEAVGLNGLPLEVVRHNGVASKVWDDRVEMKNYDHGTYSRSAEIRAMICRAIGFSVPRSLATRSLTTRFPLPNRSMWPARPTPGRRAAG